MKKIILTLALVLLSSNSFAQTISLDPMAKLNEKQAAVESKLNNKKAAVESKLNDRRSAVLERIDAKIAS